MEDKSCHEQNLGYFPYDSNKTHNLAFSTTYPESYHSDLSYDMHKNLTNTQNPCSPFEKCVKPVDTPFTGPVSAMRPLPTVVIRPPPATNGNFGQSTFSSKPARRSKPSSQSKEDSFETNLFNIPKEGNCLTSSTSVKESPLQSWETFDRKITAIYGIHLPDINSLGGFTMGCDNVQVVNSTESCSDFIDHHSTSVDSPCWKGAPSSPFSSFDIEAGNVNNVKKNTDEYYGFDHEKHQKFHSGVDSSRAFPEKVGETNKNTENECASKELSLFGAGVGFEISDDPNMARQQSVLLNNLTCGFDMKVSDTKHLVSEESAVTTLNDVSEGGAVAVHAAEKVLASPASQEDATERTMLPDPKLNVPTMIKAIHNLSELLLFHLSGDACSLEEENSENLKHVISNLHSCLNNKIVQVANKPELNNLVGDTSEKLPESRDVGTMLGSPHTSNESSDSHIKLDYQHVHQKERNFSFSGKKDEKSPIFSPLGDDLDITRDDNMTKAIKKVLEENFHLDEEMHSQSLLFKNLWLDAEAKLCSISYKARFDRMKIQMEQIKLKAPQENEDTAEMMSEVCVSPDPIKASELVGPKGHDGPIPNPTLHNVYISSPSGPADGFDASVMARFNILKSREDNPKPLNMEEEKQPEMVDGDHEGSIMARFNILKSREENSSSICMGEEKQSKAIDGEKYLGPCMSEDETLNVGLKLPQTSSYVHGAGYETLDEFHLSVTNDPIIHSFKNNRMINQNTLGWRDSSSSSDWEHTGGLGWDVPAGRRDGRISRAEETVDIPAPFDNLDQITQAFAKKTLSQDDMIALLGAHTIGRSHCTSFSDRLYNFSSTNSQDPTLDRRFAALLKRQCPRGPQGTVDPNRVVQMNISPARFENSYYVDVLRNRGLFTSDQTLTTSPDSITEVKEYAESNRKWLQDFAEAMIKMSQIEVLTGDAGEIRLDCRAINP
ncbi:hypothetical protein DH2020_031113 [Rehmannia glutinosa]|uniref:peroxidase n=1 Tax=Rehmannia glutinosa TaxID=99300 RepID=A0ABR0VLD0_REHGL